MSSCELRSEQIERRLRSRAAKRCCLANCSFAPHNELNRCVTLDTLLISLYRNEMETQKMLKINRKLQIECNSMKCIESRNRKIQFQSSFFAFSLNVCSARWVSITCQSIVTIQRSAFGIHNAAQSESINFHSQFTQKASRRREVCG